MHAMCLNLDNFGHCERRLLFNTHDLWNSLSVYFFCLPTHSILDIHFIAVDDLKTKAYESKEKIMSRTVDLISKNRLIQHAFFYSLFLCIMKCFPSTWGWIYSLRLLWANSSIHLLSQVQLWYKDRNPTIPPGKVTVFIVPCTQRASTEALLASRLLQWPSSWDTGSMAFFSPPPRQEEDEEPDVLQQDDPPLNRYL